MAWRSSVSNGSPCSARRFAAPRAACRPCTFSAVPRTARGSCARAGGAARPASSALTALCVGDTFPSRPSSVARAAISRSSARSVAVSRSARSRRSFPGVCCTTRVASAATSGDEDGSAAYWPPVGAFGAVGTGVLGTGRPSPASTCRRAVSSSAISSRFTPAARAFRATADVALGGVVAGRLRSFVRRTAAA